ncbi:MAG: 2-phosphosulfolactate phosphatase [Pseudomonadota bacterium]
MRAEDIIIGTHAGAAAEATGTAVIIDVFRAFTTAAVALGNGAERIVMLDDLDEALRLRAAGAGSRCMGERGGVAPEGFDFGNSPHEIRDVRFDGETLLQTTTNGTHGIVAAAGARRVYAGAFVTAGATARAILADPVLPVSLVAMGDGGRRRTDEDEICALYLRALLCGRAPDAGALRALILGMADLKDTRDLSSEDVAACLQVDTVPFAVRVRREGDCAEALAEYPPSA